VANTFGAKILKFREDDCNYYDLGVYYEIVVGSRCITGKHIDVAAYARELGVLPAHEIMVS
jgi:hypothetical protein